MKEFSRLWSQNFLAIYEGIFPSVFSQACKGDRDIQVGGGGGGRRKPSAYLMQIYAKIILYDN